MITQSTDAPTASERLRDYYLRYAPMLARDPLGNAARIKHGMYAMDCWRTFYPAGRELASLGYKP